MGDAGIVAGGVYPVVPAQLFVKLRQRFAPSPPIAIGGTQTIRPVLVWGSPAGLQCILQPFGQGDKTLPTLNHLHILPTRCTLTGRDTADAQKTVR